MRLRSVASVIVSLGISLAALSLPAAAQMKIRAAWSQTPGHLLPLIFSGKQGLVHYGKSYTVELVRMQASGPMMQALVGNEIEVGALATTMLYVLTNNAKADVRLVADVIQDRPGYWSSPFMVRRDSGINKVEDLRGKRVGTASIGASSDTAMRTYLRRHGLTDKDFNSIEVAFGNIPAMLMAGKIDLGIILPQFQKSVDHSQVKPLFTMNDATGSQQTVGVIMKKETIDKHRVVLLDFFEDYIRGTRWFLDPANREAAIKVAMDFTKQPRESLDYFLTKNDYYRDPDARPFIEGAQQALNVAHEAGVFPVKFDVKPYVDPSLIDEAKARIK
jgi:sulfonate transport system substrate-binding protein